MEREALYLAATKAGYSTSREEAQLIVDQMKQSFHEAENFNDFLVYLEGAEMTEDDYWTKQVDIVAKENTMAKFVNDQKDQLKLSKSIDDVQVEKLWKKTRDSIIKDQLREDNVQVLESTID